MKKILFVKSVSEKFENIIRHLMVTLNVMDTYHVVSSRSIDMEYPECFINTIWSTQKDRFECGLLG